MTTLKAVGLAGALVTSALVGGTLISAVAAAPGSSVGSGSATLADEGEYAEYCELWQATFAGELGVGVDALVPAAKTATIAVVEALVEAGELPADVGERIISQINESDGTGCRLLGAHLHFALRHAGRADFRSDLVDAAAEAIGIEPAAVVDALRDGSTLREIADDEGVEYIAVTEAMLAAADADLDAAVEAGRISQERADAILADLEQALEDDTWPPLRDGRGHRGFRAPFSAPGEASAS